MPSSGDYGPMFDPDEERRSGPTEPEWDERPGSVWGRRRVRRSEWGQPLGASLERWSPSWLAGGLILLALLLPPMALPSRALGLIRARPPAEAVQAGVASLEADRAAAMRSALPQGVSLVGDIRPLAQPVSAAMEVTLTPPEGRSAEVLEVYAWNGRAWAFAPSRSAEGQVVAEVRPGDQALALFEPEEGPLSLSVMMDSGEAWSPEAQTTAGVWVVTYTAADDGTVSARTAAPLPPETAVWPFVRPAEEGLAERLIADPEVRPAHLASLVETARAGAHPGLVLDYRPPEGQAQAYASFLGDLAEALHQEGRALGVRAPAGIDPAVVGAQADLVLIDPAEESLPGQQTLEQAIRPFLGRVARSKLRLALDARSTAAGPGGPLRLSYLEALEDLGQPSLEAAAAEGVPAGEVVAFTVSAPQEGPVFDEQALAHRFSQAGRTVYLTDAYALLRRMEVARRLGLGGVVVKHALGAGMEDDLWEILGRGAASPRPLELAYRVSGPSGDVAPLTILSRSGGSFQAPQDAGTYRLITGLSTDDGQTLLVSHQRTFQVVPAFITYTVQEGDTLSEIAFEFGISVEAIQQANALEGTLIRIGQELIIPVSGERPEPQEQEAEEEAEATPEPSPTPEAQAQAQPTPTPAPATPTPKPAAPAAGSTASVSFGYGIQAHMIHQDHGPIIAALKELGVTWVKQQVPWRDFEPSKGNIQWGELDRLVNSLSGNGFKILLSIPTSPAWALKPGSDPSVAGPPGNPKDYADFVAALAARYKGKVQMIEVWNEQNLWYEWGGRGRKLNAAEYVQLLAAAYNAIKAVDPSIIVVSGAPTPTGFNDGDTAIDDLAYLEQMYQAGLKQVSDAIGVHPSGYNNPPDAQACCYSDPTASFGAKGHRSWFFRDTMESYHNVMAKHGDGGKKLVATEFGWAATEGLGVGPTPGYEYAADNSEAEQAAFIVKAFQQAQAWGWVGPMFLWNLNLGPVAGGADEKAKFGIVRPDWSRRPAFGQLAAQTP